MAAPSEAFSECIRADGLGRLMVEDVAAVELASRFGTPLYVMSEGQLRSNYRRFSDAFSSSYPRTKILYSVKANHHPAVMRILQQEGTGADCIGAGELYVALLAGVPPDMIVLNGSNKSDAELLAAVIAGVVVNVDNLEELGRLEAMASDQQQVVDINLRLKPLLHELENVLIKEPGAHVSVAGWARSHKWGLHDVDADEAVRRALASRHLRLLGVHYHAGRALGTPEVFAAVARAMFERPGRWFQEHGWAPELLDLGGGYQHVRSEGAGPGGVDSDSPSIEPVAAALGAAIQDELERRGMPEPTLLIEPGRGIAAGAGLLLGSVGVVKRAAGDKTWAHVDASTNHLMRRWTDDYYYPAVLANRDGGSASEPVDVVGPLCITDVLAASRPLPRLERGDLLAFLDCGAYAESVAAQFNAEPRPATVLVSGASAEIITERETVQDLLAHRRIPERLLTSSSRLPIS